MVAGAIDYRMFPTIIYRTDVITDPDVMPPWMVNLACRCSGGRR